MRTTLHLPDETMIEVKVEAARGKMKMKELLLELVKAGLEVRRLERLGKPGVDPRKELAQRWLEEWFSLGNEASGRLAKNDGSIVEEMIHNRERV